MEVITIGGFVRLGGLASWDFGIVFAGGGGAAVQVDAGGAIVAANHARIRQLRAAARQGQREGQHQRR